MSEPDPPEDLTRADATSWAIMAVVFAIPVALILLGALTGAGALFVHP